MQVTEFGKWTAKAIWLEEWRLHNQAEMLTQIFETILLKNQP